MSKKIKLDSTNDLNKSEESFSEYKFKAQDEYHKRVGLISKSYKLNSILVSEFAEACTKASTTQAQQLSLMMQQFIDNVNRGA